MRKRFAKNLPSEIDGRPKEDVGGRGYVAAFRGRQDRTLDCVRLFRQFIGANCDDAYFAWRVWICFGLVVAAQYFVCAAYQRGIRRFVAFRGNRVCIADCV